MTHERSQEPMVHKNDTSSSLSSPPPTLSKTEETKTKTTTITTDPSSSSSSSSKDNNKNSAPVKEWVLKRAMDAAFWRESVRFFAATPHRNASSSLYYYDVDQHPDVRGYVALTLDDAPCRSGRTKSYLSTVLDILREANATATFMMVGDFMNHGHHDDDDQNEEDDDDNDNDNNNNKKNKNNNNNNRDGDVDDEEEDHTPDLIRLVHEGHEMGNHGMMDRAYHQDSVEEFAQAVDDCNTKIQRILRLAGQEEDSSIAIVPGKEQRQDKDRNINDHDNNKGNRVRYFRAPHGKYTRAMEGVLERRGMINVMCDTYASCPVVTDGDYIGTTLSQKAQDGSIILLHMPERDFRDWTLVALRRLLEGLRERGLQAVTVSRLQHLAQEGQQQEQVVHDNHASTSS